MACKKVDRKDRLIEVINWVSNLLLSEKLRELSHSNNRLLCVYMPHYVTHYASKAVGIYTSSFMASETVCLYFVPRQILPSSICVLLCTIRVWYWSFVPLVLRWHSDKYAIVPMAKIMVTKKHKPARIDNPTTKQSVAIPPHSWSIMYQPSSVLGVYSKT